MRITTEQSEFLAPYIKNLERLLISNNIEDLLLAIDDAIVDTFDKEGNPNSVGIKLQQVYDDIYRNAY